MVELSGHDEKHILVSALLRIYSPWAWKSKCDRKGVKHEGWFIAGMSLPFGQIAWYMPAEYWQRLSWVREKEACGECDGFESAESLERLYKLVFYGYEGVG